MSACHVTLGKYLKALDLQRKALVTYEPFYEERHHLIADAHLHLGVCFYSSGNLPEALVSYERASSLYREIFKTRLHPTYATALSHRANALAAMGKFDEALQVQERALAIRITLFGHEHPVVGNSLNNMGNYLISLQRFDEALNCFKQSLVIFGFVFDKRHPDVIFTLSCIDTCQNRIDMPKTRINTGTRAEPKLSKADFRQLLTFAIRFLAANKVSVEKNPSGFVRIRIPVPADFDRATKSRLSEFIIGLPPFKSIGLMMDCIATPVILKA